LQRVSLRSCRLAEGAGEPAVAIARLNARLRLIDLQHNDAIDRIALARRVAQLPQLAQLLL
jgi:hypothetical protein